MTTYKVQRLYFRRPGHKQTLLTGLTLEQAREHCRNPETSSSTCKLARNIRRTERLGAWFDSYTEE